MDTFVNILFLPFVYKTGNIQSPNNTKKKKKDHEKKKGRKIMKKKGRKKFYVHVCFDN